MVRLSRQSRKGVTVQPSQLAVKLAGEAARAAAALEVMQADDWEPAGAD